MTHGRPVHQPPELTTTPSASTGVSCAACAHWRPKESRPSPIFIVYLRFERAKGLCCRYPEARASTGDHHCGEFKAAFEDPEFLFDTALKLRNALKQLELRTAQKKEHENRIKKLKSQIESMQTPDDKAARRK